MVVIRSRGSVCESCDIRETAICAVLRPEELPRLNAIVSAQDFAAQQTIFYEDDPAETLYNVTNGCVRLSKMLADGRRQITGFLMPGDFLGLAYYENYAYTAEAIGQVRVCVFPRDKFQALLGEFPQFERRLLSRASNELAAAQDQLLLLGRKGAKEKLASFLLLLSRRAKYRGLVDPALDLPMTRNDIADYVGLTTETVSRTFTKLVDAGTIELTSPQHVVIHQPEMLEELAGEFG